MSGSNQTVIKCKGNVNLEVGQDQLTICGQPLEIYIEVARERIRQETKWGQQNHQPIIWSNILGEEFGEVYKAINEAIFNGSSWLDYREELVQVAAVAIAAVESLDRNTK